MGQQGVGYSSYETIYYTPSMLLIICIVNM